MSCRKTKMLQTEQKLLDEADKDKVEYQNRLFRTGNSSLMYKHLKSMTKTSSFAYQLALDREVAVGFKDSRSTETSFSISLLR